MASEGQNWNPPKVLTRTTGLLDGAPTDAEMKRLQAIEAAARAYVRVSDHEGAADRSVEQQIDDIEAVYVAYDALKAALEAGDG